jgi:hypothetical protein
VEGASNCGKAEGKGRRGDVCPLEQESEGDSDQERYSLSKCPGGPRRLCWMTESGSRLGQLMG